jgi:hypothetical protein
VSRGWITAERLYDGSVNLEQLAEMNDLLDVEDENVARLNPPVKK